MKLQHLAVIFIIIIMPISLVISTYVTNLIDVSNKEAKYDTVLMNATYDAVRSYQINTINNSFASVNSSRVRDINASINSYFNSLGTGLSAKGLSRNELEEYVPALLFTLYDGFYVYGPFENYTNITGNTTNFNTSDTNKSTQYGLKPYNYYTCEYKKGDDYHFIINYTLDNYITVIGKYKEGTETKYITKSGYYVDPSKYKVVDDKKTVEINGSSIIIGPEELGEYVYVYNSKRIKQASGIGTRTVNLKGKLKYYRYINYNEEKYYYDDDMDIQDANDDSLGYIRKNGQEDRTQPIPIFYLDKNLKIYISDNMLRTLAINRLGGNGSEEDIEKMKEDLRTGDSDAFKDINNYYYYRRAVDFSNEVYGALKRIDLGDSTTDSTTNVIVSSAYNNNGNYKVEAETKEGTTIKTEGNTEGIHQKFKFNNSNGKSNGKIFDYNMDMDDDGKKDNDPETESSYFNQHRMDVIISDIEANLASTISNFNKYQYGSYDYRMPMISEDDWYKIANNVNVMSFLQGFAVGNYKFYNNYCVVANTKNKEFVSREAIYVQKNAAKTVKKVRNEKGYNEKGYGYGYNPNVDPSNVDNFDPKGSYTPPYNGAQTELYELYKNNNYEQYYHNPRCAEFNKDVADIDDEIIAYRSIDYEPDSFSHDYTNLNDKMTEIQTLDSTGVEAVNYYMQPGTGGYECIVSMNDPMFTYDELITGTTREVEVDGEKVSLNDKVRKAYLSALAREKGAAFKNFQALNYDTDNINANEWPHRII